MIIAHMWMLCDIDQIDMNRAVFLLVFLLVLGTIARKNLKEAAKEEKKTVVQANHFYSNYERNTTYDITNIEKNKSLVYLLKPNGKAEKELKENPITIELISGSATQTCTFKSFQQMCALKEVNETSMKLKIECKTTPCELSWVIYQPAAISKDGSNAIETLVEVNQDYNHATIIVSCNDPNIKTFAKDIQLYTNSVYTRLEDGGIIYYLFDNEQKGYYFISTEKEAARSCARANLKHSADQIEFNQKNSILQDFVMPGKSNEYLFKKTPDYDFRIDAFFHVARNQQLSSKEGLVITLIGETAGKKNNISSVTIQGEKKRAVDFSAVFKKPTDKYDTLLFEISSVGKEILVVSMDFVSSQRQEVNLGESTYFRLTAGQTLNFKLLPQEEETSETRLTHIFSSDDKLFVSSLTQCKTKSGCEFTLTAKEAGEGSLYFGDGTIKNETEVVLVDFNRTVTRKIRQGEIVFLKAGLKAKKAIQGVVNSPNVVIYAANKDKCEVVTPQCHEKVINFHNPAIFQSKADTDMVFRVEGLDTCEFTLTLIEDGAEYIELRDSQPFAYLLDDAEKEILFKFKLASKQDAHFNLIAPVGELTLSVYNRQEADENAEGEVSTDGYITFEKDNIDGLSFVVRVSKREGFIEKYIHFTLLVSTKEGNVRLEPGVTQFETIPAEETRDFVVEYQPNKDMLINFYTHNIRNTELNILAQVSTTDEYDKPDQLVEYTLDTEADVLDIKDPAKQLCKSKSGENCELFLRLTNKMAVEIDVTLTLMIKDSIIELKDGIWNSYKINSIAENTHFYFLPKSKNRSITILYRSDFIDLKPMYALWKSDDKSFSPSEWPFPLQYKGEVGNSLQYTPTRFIHIDSEALKGCWPNCVVLISTFKDEKSLKSTYNSFLQESQFKIMASSNFIEVPEKHKIDIVLKKDEAKHLLVDLKYALDKEALTFFTYFTIGSVQLSANVYEEANPRCPTGDDPADFRFGNLETQISVANVKRKLQENGLSLDRSPYICILAQAYLDSKFSIEYISDDGLIKQLTLDNFYTHKSEANKVAYLQVDASQEFTVKITRTEGFPYIAHTVCKSGDDFEQCLQKFKDTKQEIQLADKMTSFGQEPCDKCILFMRFRSPEPSNINIHIQSKYAETELIENQMLTDELPPKGENKYQLTSIQNQEILINIQILHGDISVNLFDFADVNLTKTNTKGSTNIHITVPPKDRSKRKDTYGTTFLGFYDFSTFTSLHMSIKSQNESVGAQYTITYSSGEAEIFLQDGLISEYAIMPNKSTKFLYRNPALSRIYLHLSMTDAALLNKLKVKILAMKDEADEESGVQIKPETPNFKKKTPNPTMIMALPANKLFQIEITNPDKNYQLLTIGINNREIIYLPYNHEFPLQLQKGQYSYLVLNTPYQTYLQVEFKKCDESTLTIAYTTSYEDFVNEEFSYQQEMGEEELITDLQIKTKTVGSVYIKVKSPDDDDSLLTVKAAYTFIKNKAEKVKAGNKGLVEYKMLDSEKAELSFSPLICPTGNKACNKDFAYSSISSTKVQDIYAQLVCSSISFDLVDRQIIKQVQSTPIPAANAHDNKIVFSHTIKESNEFVGVKAVNNKTGEIVYYKPVEIMTVWGQISKQSKGHGRLILTVLGVFLCCCCTLVCFRRKQKGSQGYAPLNAQD